MKSVYERTDLIITEFDTDDVIATSGETVVTEPLKKAIDNNYFSYGDLQQKLPGAWF